jgi:hypothetical protein
MAQDIEKTQPGMVRQIGGHRVVHPAAMMARRLDPLTGRAAA